MTAPLLNPSFALFALALQEPYVDDECSTTRVSNTTLCNQIEYKSRLL